MGPLRTRGVVERVKATALRLSTRPRGVRLQYLGSGLATVRVDILLTSRQSPLLVTNLSVNLVSLERVKAEVTTGFSAMLPEGATSVPATWAQV